MQVSDVLKVAIRPPVPADQKPILDSWQKTFLGQGRARPRGLGPLSTMRRSAYFDGQATLVGRLLRNPSTQMQVACDAAHPDFLVGWCCYSPEQRLLHFLYVWGLHRQRGYGAQLMEASFARLGELPITVTHWTRVMPFYRAKWRLEYNPFVLYEVAK